MMRNNVPKVKLDQGIRYHVGCCTSAMNNARPFLVKAISFELACHGLLSLKTWASERFFPGGE